MTVPSRNMTIPSRSMTAPFIMSALTLFLALSTSSVVSLPNYCSVHNFDASKHSSQLQFTKELSTEEYSVKSKFKSLHCCSKGYKSIEWFKDGQHPFLISQVYHQSSVPPEQRSLPEDTWVVLIVGVISFILLLCVLIRYSPYIYLYLRSLCIPDISTYADAPLPTYSLPKRHYSLLGQNSIF
ncbi:uncharacterized protein LOC113469968 [Diaphorina citri]|uniref:Uncharacterized protein LOC113469968 n=1 Tax=Diaphorina citri TaxID=121845 RepID=A0A3Q0J5Z5_DIACI|nr:uncharacterized protein LOC113469968 [Diaphorina citri]